MYSDAEFDVDSDFAIKHDLKIRFGRDIDVKRLMATKMKPNASILHFEIAVKPIKMKSFQCWLVHSHAELDGKSDFAIKHDLDR